MVNLRDVALLCLASAGALQAQHRYPLRYVGPVEARSAVAIGTTFPVLRMLPNGGVAVTDTVNDKTYILDASFALVSTSDSAQKRGGAFVAASRTDSAPVMRLNARTNSVDTVTRIRVATSHFRLDTLSSGQMKWRATLEVLPTIDEWTSLPDGTIAVVRGADYHIDWYRTDGTRTSTPPMQIDWRRMTDAEKKMRVETIRAAYEASNAESLSASDAPSIEFSAPNTLPDYLPPVFIGGVKSDPQGNVWIAPSSSSYAGYAGFMYDVVNGRGQITERVRLPKDRVLVGFGNNGDIYMVAMEANGMYLERTRK